MIRLRDMITNGVKIEFSNAVHQQITVARFVPSAWKDCLFMHSPETVQRFIELRAQGWTYARLMVDLNVTKPTLIAWSRKYQFDIQNLHSIKLEALREKWLTPATVCQS
jgi:hypothetical protein